MHVKLGVAVVFASDFDARASNDTAFSLLSRRALCQSKYGVRIYNWERLRMEFELKIGAYSNDGSNFDH
jgi:hypothetical protein